MATYTDLVISKKDLLVIKAIKVIDNKTMKTTYAIYTNLHIDYGICKEMMNSFYGTSKKKFNKELQLYMKLTGRKAKLSKTDNDINHTRLIYFLV